MIELIGISRNCELYLPRSQAQLRRRFLNSMDGKEVIETLRRQGKSKSWDQVKAHFGLCVVLIRERMDELGWDIFGVLPTKEMIHEILTQCCAGVGEDGGIVRLSDMTTGQAAQFFENVRSWAATQLNLNIPDPDPNWRQK